MPLAANEMYCLTAVALLLSQDLLMIDIALRLDQNIYLGCINIRPILASNPYM